MFVLYFLGKQSIFYSEPIYSPFFNMEIYLFKFYLANIN